MRSTTTPRGRPESLTLKGEEFVADPSGALYWPRERLLAVADLHLEKGSSYAARGVFLPPYDTRATLMALARLISAYRPRRVVALGDSFHDVGASARLGDEDRESVRALQRGCDWVWIAGNHDPAPPSGLPGEAAQELRVGAVVFRHEPCAERGEGEIAGHLHPAARLVGRGGPVRGRSFLSDGRRCVLPAFGAFAGGLNVRDAAFCALFGAAPVIAHVIGRAGVYAVPRRLCAPD